MLIFVRFLTIIVRLLSLEKGASDPIHDRSNALMQVGINAFGRSNSCA